MLAVMITAVLMYFMLQNSEALPFRTACWDEQLSRTGRNSSCVASQPFLIFGNGKAIHRMDLDGKNQRRLVASVGTPILLDFHFQEERVYWADKLAGVIYKTSVRGAHRQKLYSSDKHISGLAVDWIWNSVFWTSEEKGKIKRMDINGKNQRTLLRHLTKPSSIAVDPTKRFLFWLSGGLIPSIQRSDVTGQMKTTLVKIAQQQQLKALSIDHGDKRLFWVQFGLQGESAIASCDYNGNVLHVIDHPLRSQSLGISIFMEHLYYIDAASRAIKQVNKYTGRESLDINKKPMPKIPFSIKVVHSLNQPTADTPSPFPGCEALSGNCVDVCSNVAEQGTCQCREGFALSKQGTYCEDVNECAHWNHGCSLGCENVPGSYFCTCPKGYALLPDRKTCQGCSSADRGGCSQLCTPVTPSGWQCSCLPGYQLHQDGKRCIATGPPPYLLVANIIDVRRINPDGTGDQTLVEDSRGTIIALDYDPVQNIVYFANTSQKTIEQVDLKGGSRDIFISENLNSPEGLAIDWVHRRIYWTDRSQATVECCTLVGRKRETLVSTGLEKPRGIAVHPLAKKLFWTDTGAQPIVERASLEGKDRVVIVSTNLVSPSGLTIDFTEDRLFWCDHRRGLVETAALDGSDRRILLENQVGRPFDLAVFEDRLWISDQENQQLRSVHKRTGKPLQRIQGNMVQPASVVVVHPLAKPGADVCLHLNGGCEQVCESKLGIVHCSCQSLYTLSADGKSCVPADASNGTAGDSFSPVLPKDIDECKLGTHNCNKNAECQNTMGKYLCKCLAGYHGNGQMCQGCCVTGYMGERCQFSDLEWWELQQAEEEKRRNVVIAACMVVLISLLSIAACVTYCYRTRRLFPKHPSVDNVSETSVTDKSMSETTTTSLPRSGGQLMRAKEGINYPLKGFARIFQGQRLMIMMSGKPEYVYSGFDKIRDGSKMLKPKDNYKYDIL
ncbi:Pro-epidermal growth factor [Channa argus]|uniref:Pro-epidermal growth factor n=1 Tax=Channa argus TaxID=215402 RepID=A0A6G1PV99_CHAAH|nr:Pro-epidermal growth factor [Channa argus]